MSERSILVLITGFGIAPLLLNGTINHFVRHNDILFWQFDILTWVIVPSFVCLAIKKLTNIPASSFGFRIELFGRNSVLVFVLVCFFLIPVNLYLYLLANMVSISLFSSNVYFSYKEMAPENFWVRMSYLMYLALSAGIVEEFYYRGLIFKICQYFNHCKIIFLLVSPALFGASHWEGGMELIFSTYIYGFFLSFIYLRIRNLWPLIVGHTCVDLAWFI